ncbi:MAG: DUF4145 domain-containing protein [bacterium]
MDITKAHCNGCLGERNHEILHAHESKWDNEESGFSGSDLYELLKCCGCEKIALRHTCWFSEDIDPQTGDLEPSVNYYPPPISRQRPRWFAEVYRNEALYDLNCLLEEIYIGLQNKSVRLATMGIRALLENMMIQKVGDHGSFSSNLSELHSKGFVTEEQKKILDTVLEAGHAVMHRQYSPNEGDLISCMDIVESLIETIYVHPGKAAELSKKIPHRCDKKT